MTFPDNPTYEQVFEPLLKMNKEQALQWMEKYAALLNTTLPRVVANEKRHIEDLKNEIKKDHEDPEFLNLLTEQLQTSQDHLAKIQDPSTVAWANLHCYFTLKADPKANEYINNLFSDQTTGQ